MPNLKFSQFDTETTTTSVTGIVGYNTTANKNIQITPANFVTSAGTGVFLPLAGGTMTGTTNHGDSVESTFGNSGDFIIKHTGDTYLSNTSGDLYFRQQATDGDIIFQSDNGSGGEATYITIDGTNVRTKFSKNTIHTDNIKANFGNGSDLSIYHDGSNSYIDDTSGQGSLYVNTNAFRLVSANKGENMFSAFENAQVQLYYNNSVKLATTDTGISVTGGGSFTGDVNMSNTSGVTLNMNTNSAGDTSKILLHEGTTSSPANGASIRYDGSANQFRIGVGANVDTTRLTIDRGTGNVGIGTTSPQAKLEVVGSGTAAIFGDGTRAFKVYTDADEVSLLAEGSVPMKFYTSGAEKMRIDSGGNVGIGTDSPTKNLQITSSGNAELLLERASGAQILLQAQASAGVVGVQTNDRLDFKTNGATRMSISNTGDVGIGTTSPANNLQVKTSSDGGGITIQRNSSTSNAFADLMFSISTSDSASPETKIRATRGASYDDTDISFITSNTEKMRISSAGNVGIGTDSPTATLHVESADDAILRLKSTDNKAYIALSDNDTNGYISSEGSKLSLGANLGVNANNLNIDLANNRVGIGVSSPGRLLTLSGSASPYLSLVSNTTGGSPSIFFGDTADDNEGRITYSNASDYMALFTAATERIRINSSGNVGIGVSSPASKLEVDGGDIEIDDSASGLILRSPDGTRYRVTVANGGAISASAV